MINRTVLFIGIWKWFTERNVEEVSKFRLKKNLKNSIYIILIQCYDRLEDQNVERNTESKASDQNISDRNKNT